MKYKIVIIYDMRSPGPPEPTVPIMGPCRSVLPANPLRSTEMFTLARSWGSQRHLKGMMTGGSPKTSKNYIWLVVWLPWILFSQLILGMSASSQLTDHIFQRGGPTTNQIWIGKPPKMDDLIWGCPHFTKPLFEFEHQNDHSRLTMRFRVFFISTWCQLRPRWLWKYKFLQDFVSYTRETWTLNGFILYQHGSECQSWMTLKQTGCPGHLRSPFQRLQHVSILGFPNRIRMN